MLDLDLELTKSQNLSKHECELLAESNNLEDIKLGCMQCADDLLSDQEVKMLCNSFRILSQCLPIKLIPISSN